MKKIIVTVNLDLYSDQVERLKKLGTLKIYNDMPKSPEEWLKRCQGYDIICGGKFGLKKKIYDLKDVFISLPFVGIDWIDKEKLKGKNVIVSYAPGCNKDAVSEWVMAMMINLIRKFPDYINVKVLPKHQLPERTVGLTGKKVCILGAGHIGTRVGKLCKAFDMNVDYFRRGDSLLMKCKNSDIVINCLRRNKSTEGFLGRRFFGSMKKGSYFVSITSIKIFDVNSLIIHLGKNIAGAAVDHGSMQEGDTDDKIYKKLIKNKKILATPHIAYNTDTTARVANDMMIDNIESYLKGKKKNLI